MTDKPYIPFKRSCMGVLSGRVRKKFFVGFDVETVGDSNEFYSGGLWWEEDGEECWQYFLNKREMIDYMLHKRFLGKVFVATNLSFDFNALFFGTPEYDLFHSKIMRGSRMLLAEWRPEGGRMMMQKDHSGQRRRGSSKGRVLFYDTMNFAPVSLEKLGRIIGVEKLQKPEWLGLRKPFCYDEARQLEEYNKQDCKVSCCFMDFLQEGINNMGGVVQMTGASTALDTYRRGFQKQKLVKEEFVLQDTSVTEHVFEAYYGGRTEAFARGTVERANYYDINSLYPSVMRNPYPLPQSVKRIENPTESLVHRYMGVVRARVRAPSDMLYPILPLRGRGKLLFPVGEFEGVYNHCELSYALNNGYELLSLSDMIIYQERFYPFKEYVETLYNKRLEYKAQKSSMEFVCKLLMNSLYGKMAQKELEDYQYFSDHNAIPHDLLRHVDNKNSPYKTLCVGDAVILSRKKKSKGVFIQPILSSYTTSYARILMHQYIKRYGALYTDTDSIITTSEIPTSSALGDMKLEVGGERGVIVKPKFYLFGDDVKIKGLSRASQDDFFTLIGGGGVEKMRFSSLRESVRRGYAPNKKVFVTKVMSVEDNKREWEQSFSLDELQYSKPLSIVQDVYGNVYREDEIHTIANKEYTTLVNMFLKERPHIKQFFKGRVRELKEAMNIVLDKGLELDLIDWESMDNTVPVLESLDSLLEVDGVSVL